MTRTVTTGQLARDLGAELRGDPDVVLHGVADVVEAGPGELTFVTRPKYIAKLAESRASAVLVSREFGATPMTALACDRVDRAVAQALAHFAEPPWHPPAGLHEASSIDPAALVAPDARVGAFVTIGPGSRVGARCLLYPGVFIGADATVGNDCVLGPNAYVGDRCVLGDRVVLKPGAVIGGDGYGFYFDQGAHHRVPHTGNVILEDDVEIGSASCVDRAKFGSTRVGAGSKIDNQVQIAHNCSLGAHSLMAGQAATAGSVRTGPYCVLGGRSGILEGATVGERVTVAAVSVSVGDIESGMTVLGYPAAEIGNQRRILAAQRRLPELMEELRRLRVRVEQLEASANDQSGG